MNKPVLFLIFNRLDTTIKVFEKIREARPPRLYIASDGWRDDVIDEKQKVLSVREYVLSNIDWECQVKTKFNEKNLGCGKAVSSAITWFFENEDHLLDKAYLERYLYLSRCKQDICGIDIDNTIPEERDRNIYNLKNILDPNWRYKFLYENSGQRYKDHYKFLYEN